MLSHFQRLRRYVLQRDIVGPFIQKYITKKAGGQLPFALLVWEYEQGGIDLIANEGNIHLILGAFKIAIRELERRGCLKVSCLAPEWQDMSSAPTDGTPFLGIVECRVRKIIWGKTSHVPIYGYCLADQGEEDFDVCEPTKWQPYPEYVA